MRQNPGGEPAATATLNFGTPRAIHLRARFATTTVATGQHDPLRSCVEAFGETFVNDRLLVRRLPVLVQAAGFENLSLLQSYGLIESLKPSLSHLDRAGR